MSGSTRLQVDPVEELRLRRWARENYVLPERRDSSWHPVVLDEMRRKDEESGGSQAYCEVARRAVPLSSGQPPLRGPHLEPARSHVLLRVPVLD